MKTTINSSHCKRVNVPSNFNVRNQSLKGKKHMQKDKNNNGMLVRLKSVSQSVSQEQHMRSVAFINLTGKKSNIDRQKKQHCMFWPRSCHTPRTSLLSFSFVRLPSFPPQSLKKRTPPSYSVHHSPLTLSHLRRANDDDEHTPT